MEFAEEILAFRRIIDLLSPAAQSLLFSLDHISAACQLRTLRNITEQWECRGVTLDPVQQEVVLDSIVAHFVAIALVDQKGYREIYDLGYAAGHAAGVAKSGAKGP